MSVDYQTAKQVWPIELPVEPPHDRILVAYRPDGVVASQWEHTTATGSWVRIQDPVRWHSSWGEIVARCIHAGWTLRSLPGGAA